MATILESDRSERARRSFSRVVVSMGTTYKATCMASAFMGRVSSVGANFTFFPDVSGTGGVYALEFLCNVTSYDFCLINIKGKTKRRNK